jgi:hypothetical protein
MTAADPMPDLETGTAARDALEQAKARRADLHTVLVNLEAAIAAPAHGRAPAWSEHVHDALVEVAGAWERHIAVVEGPGGLFEEVMHAAPHLANDLDRLRREHLEIRAELGLALDAVRVVAGAPVRESDQGREVVLSILGRLMRHRQHGADLVFDAYAVDIGTGD